MLLTIPSHTALSKDTHNKWQSVSGVRTTSATVVCGLFYDWPPAEPTLCQRSCFLCDFTKLTLLKQQTKSKGKKLLTN